MNNYLHILEFFRTFAAESCKENKIKENKLCQRLVVFMEL